MAVLPADFIAALPGQGEVIGIAFLDTVSGAVSGVDGMPEGALPTKAWIAVSGGSELYFEVQAFHEGGDYQVVDVKVLERFQVQFEWLAEAAGIAVPKCRFWRSFSWIQMSVMEGWIPAKVCLVPGRCGVWF
jgi:hypothetical protein